EPLAFAFGQHATLRFTVEQAVLVLDAHESRGAGARRPLGIAQLFDGEVRAADLADLASPDQFVESAERVSDRRFGIGLVELVEVDAIGAETPQAVLDRPPDVIGPGAAPALVHRPCEPGGEPECLAARSEGAAEELLALSVAIDV